MIFIELFKQAFDSLKANKLRSFLTMLGIVMGVFSVIAIMAIGNATESYIAGEFEKIGANLPGNFLPTSGSTGSVTVPGPPRCSRQRHGLSKRPPEKPEATSHSPVFKWQTQDGHCRPCPLE